MPLRENYLVYTEYLGERYTPRLHTSRHFTYEGAKRFKENALKIQGVMAVEIWAKVLSGAQDIFINRR